MISLFLMILAGICNAVMDKLQFNYDSSIFKNLNPLFWDPRVSWKNQWQQPMVPPYKYWWYFGLYVPRYQEHYIYSNTILVFTTDAWHLAKAFMLLWISLAIVSYSTIFNFWADAFIMYCAFTITFTYFYEYILDAKDSD
jgi:hypothetical protein